MKLLNKLLILLILVAILLIVEGVTGVLGVFDSPSKIVVERTEINMGRDILGDKISIRDNIEITQSGRYFLDGNLLGLGNERKFVEISFLSEIGYFMDDVINSERLDSIIDEALISRTLRVTVPYPDTLSFIEMRQKESNYGWFWEGWYKDQKNIAVKKAFLIKMEKEAYSQFYNNELDPSTTNILSKASQSILNYVNNGYKIANERGFDRIETTFVSARRKDIIVKCDVDGNCIETNVVEMLN